MALPSGDRIEELQARDDAGSKVVVMCRSDADIAVVFYAGHGIEVNGNNYLIPIDAVLRSDIDVEDETVSLDRVSQIVEPARRLRLIILDACRDNRQSVCGQDAPDELLDGPRTPRTGAGRCSDGSRRSSKRPSGQC